MRHYPINSQDSVARIVALALLADGAINLSELRLMSRRDILRRTGMDHRCFNRVVEEFFEDIQENIRLETTEPFEIDAETVDQLLGEIRQRALQKTVLRTILDIVDADQNVDGGEAVLLTQAVKTWGIDLFDVSATPGSPGHRAARSRSRSVSA